MRCKLLLTAVIIVFPLHAEWKRHVVTDKGDSTDVPAPHSIAYFTHDALLRDEDGGNGCDECAREGKAEVNLVGDVRGYSIYDVLYYCPCYENNGAPGAHSIIVKTGPDQYREIFYVLFPTLYGGPGPSTLVKANEQQHILWTRVDGGGNQHPVDEYGFWFDSDGATGLDMGVLWNAPWDATGSASFAPSEETMIWNATLSAKGSTLIFQVPVWDKHDLRSPLVGSVDIELRIDRGRLIVTGKSYHRNRPAQ